MNLRFTYVSTLLVLAAACGGSAFTSNGDPGTGGSSSGGNISGGGTSHAGSSSDAGQSTAGSIASAGSASTSGATSMGGSVSTGGSADTGGTMTGVSGSVGTGGSMDCGFILCAQPKCADGAKPVTPPGACCPTCDPPPQVCPGVTCEPVTTCPMGYSVGQPSGACCQGCVPNPGGVACPKIACGDKQCPAGYVRGDLVGGCCTDCVPDPLYCNADTDCVIANRPRPCCGCPEAISTRQYSDDACWFLPGMPRMIPQSCQPQVVCNVVCTECPASGAAVCQNHRCTESGGAK